MSVGHRPYRIPAWGPDLIQCIWSVCCLIHRGRASLVNEGSLVFLNSLFFLNIVMIFLRSHPVLGFGDGSVEKVLSEPVWGAWLRSVKWKCLNAASFTPDKWGREKNSSVNIWRMYLSLCVHTRIHVRLHMWVCECRCIYVEVCGWCQESSSGILHLTYLFVCLII